MLLPLIAHGGLISHEEFLEICRNNDCRRLSTILDSVPNWRVSEWLGSPIDGSDFPLFIAVRCDCFDICDQLLAAGDNVNRVGFEDGITITPIHIATLSRRHELVRHLLQRGASPNIADSNGITPLFSAADSGDFHSGSLLLEAGADPDHKLERHALTPVHMAAHGGWVEMIRLLLDNGGSPDAVSNINSFKPLHGAVVHGHTCAVAALLSHSGQVGERGNNLLHLAVDHNYPVICTLLLQAGAQPSRQKNEEGLTPLDLINRIPRPLTARQSAIVKLIQAKARLWPIRCFRRHIMGRNPYGETLIHRWARSEVSAQPIDLLNSENPLLSMPRSDGCSPLHLAVIHGDALVLMHLVAAGADLSPLNIEQVTPLMLADSCGNRRFVGVLAPAIILQRGTSQSEGAGSEGVISEHEHDILLRIQPTLSLQEWAASAVRRQLGLRRILDGLQLGQIPLLIGWLVLGVEVKLSP